MTWLGVACAYTLVILIVALIAPPNSIDSVQYHMPRVAHWAQQQSIANYATPIERQLYMPPFSEMAILQLYILFGGDRLANLVQWGSMSLSLAVVSLITLRLRGGPQAQALAVLFAVTLPMGVLQASGTQNDYVTTLWVLCLAHFAVKAHQGPLTAGEQVLAGLASGLGVMTKATFIAFALPLLIWLGISAIRHAGWRNASRFALLGLSLTVILNAGTWARNLRTFDTPVGPRWAVSLHANEFISWRVVLSNLVRGTTLNLATPYGDANGLMREAVSAIHRWIGLDVNDPRTTYGTYRVKRSINEQYAGYPYHYLLIPVCLALLVWQHRRPPRPFEDPEGRAPATIPFAAAVLAGYLVFCTIYKWQWTGNRLHLPFYVAWAPMAGLALDWTRRAPLRPCLRNVSAPAVAMLLIATSLRPLLINPSRPLIPRAPDGISLLTTPRDEILFVDTPEAMRSYLNLIDAARQTGCDSFGMVLTTDFPEYPFWALLAPPGSGIRLEHLDANSWRWGLSAAGPCGVICTTCEDLSPEDPNVVYGGSGGYRLYVDRSPQQ